MGLFFWPFMIASLILAILSISMKKTLFLYFSAILIFPLSLYLTATPRFEIWGLIFPFFYVGAAVALARKVIWASILLVIPNFILIGWIGFAVITQ